MVQGEEVRRKQAKYNRAEDKWERLKAEQDAFEADNPSDGDDEEAYPPLDWHDLQ